MDVEDDNPWASPSPVSPPSPVVPKTKLSAPAPAPPTTALDKLSVRSDDAEDGPGWGIDSSPSVPVAAKPALPDVGPTSPAPGPAPTLPSAPSPKVPTAPEDEPETVDDPWAPPPWSGAGSPVVSPVHVPSVPSPVVPSVGLGRSPSPIRPVSSPPGLSTALSTSIDDDASPWGPPPDLTPASDPTPEPGTATMSKSALESKITERFAPAPAPEPEPAPAREPAPEPRSQPEHIEQPKNLDAQQKNGQGENDTKVTKNGDDAPAPTGGVLSKLKGIMSKGSSSTPGASTDAARTSSEVSPRPSIESTSPATSQAPWLARLKANQKLHARSSSSVEGSKHEKEQKPEEQASGFKQVTNNAAPAPRNPKSVLSSWLSSNTTKPHVVSAQDEDDDDLFPPATTSTTHPPSTHATDLLSFGTPQPQPQPQPSNNTATGSWWSNLTSRATNKSTPPTQSPQPTGIGASDLDWLESASSAPTQLAQGGTLTVDLLGDTAAHLGEIPQGYDHGGTGDTHGTRAPLSGSGSGSTGGGLGSSLLGRAQPKRVLSRAEREKLRAQQMAAESSAGTGREYRDDPSDDVPTYDPESFREAYRDVDPPMRSLRSGAYGGHSDQPPVNRQPSRPLGKSTVVPTTQQTTAHQPTASNQLAPPISDLLGDLSGDASFGDFASSPTPPTHPVRPTAAQDPFADLISTPSQPSQPYQSMAQRTPRPVEPQRTGSLVSQPAGSSMTTSGSGSRLGWLPPPPGRHAAHPTSGSGPGTPTPPPPSAANAAPNPAPQPRSSVADDLKLLADL